MTQGYHCTKQRESKRIVAASTVTRKGRITIPVEVQNELGLKPASRVGFLPLGNGSCELVPIVGSVMVLQGALAAPDRPVTLRQVEAALAAGAAERQAQ